MLSDPMKKTAIGLAAVGMCNYLAHGYARAPDVICPTEVRLLPACGADEGPGPSPPPLAAVVTVVASTASNIAIIPGGTYVHAITDQEHSLPSKPAGALSITLS